ncbi:MAG: hypothetical protein JSS17_13445 [Proteobacteria bacterium]|nr:hypothetical protein [Pseudomonadota bacterium]
MPNWVYHRMRLTGSPQALERFVAQLKREAGEGQDQGQGQDQAPTAYALDFNVWVPMPAELEAMEVGGSSHLGDELLAHMAEPWEAFVAQHHWCAQLCQVLPTKDILVVGDLVRWLDAQPRPDAAQPLTAAQAALQQLQHCLSLGRTRLRHIERHGHADWYDWSLEHWGTKWNGGTCSVRRNAATELELCFETAWNSPEPVLRRIAQAHPTLSGQIDYLDEGFGFAGTYRFGAQVPGGFEDEPTSDAAGLAREVFDWEVDDEEPEPDEVPDPQPQPQPQTVRAVDEHEFPID